MKLLKYLPIALLAVFATACDCDSPNPNQIAPGVYFSKANIVNVKTSTTDATKVVPFDICRTFNTVGTVVNVSSKVEEEVIAEDGTSTWRAATAADAGCFDVPKQVVFSNNYSKTSANVTVNNLSLPIDQRFRVTVNITQCTECPDCTKRTQVSLYGKGTYSFYYIKRKAEAWVEMGLAKYVDGFILAAYGVDPNQYAWNVPIQRNASEPGLYRLVNPYGQATCPLLNNNENPDKDTDYYIVIDLKNPMVPKVMPSLSGYYLSDMGSFIITNIEGDYAYKGATDDEIMAEVAGSPYASSFANNVLTVNLPLFYNDKIEGDPNKWKTIVPAVITFPANTQVNSYQPKAEAVKQVSGKLMPFTKSAF